MKRVAFVLLAFIFLLTQTPAFAYPPAPTIDGVFTGYSVGDPSHEYSGGTESIGAFGNKVYFQNDGSTLYFMNDWTYDKTNNNDPATSLDYNIFDFDIDKNGSFEWRIIIYADGDAVVLKDGMEVPVGTNGTAAAAGWGPSPNDASVHRIYEISINHGGIGNELDTKPLDPPGSAGSPPPPKPPDKTKPSEDPKDVSEAFPGSVTPAPSGAPSVKLLDVGPAITFEGKHKHGTSECKLYTISHIIADKDIKEIWVIPDGGTVKEIIAQRTDNWTSIVDKEWPFKITYDATPDPPGRPSEVQLHVVGTTAYCLNQMKFIIIATCGGEIEGPAQSVDQTKDVRDRRIVPQEPKCDTAGCHAKVPASSTFSLGALLFAAILFLGMGMGGTKALQNHWQARRTKSLLE